MSIYHDEIEIEDMEYDEETETYYYPCPCGDKFQISKVKLYGTDGLHIIATVHASGISLASHNFVHIE